MTDTPAEAEAEPLNDTMVNVKAKAEIDSPGDTLSEVDAKTLGDTLSNFEVVTLVGRQLATHWATKRPRHWLTPWTRD